MEKTIVRKIRHIPTGLFYQPTKGRWSHQKSNLSVKGKIYETKQCQKNLEVGHVYISEALLKKHPNIKSEKGYSGTNLVVTEKKDWEIVNYELKEI